MNLSSAFEYFRRLHHVLLFCLLAYTPSMAQTAVSDTAFLQTALHRVQDLYKAELGMQAHLYNGTEYVDYKKSFVEGSQFFESQAVAHGSIFYDGAWYTQVPMLYDLVMDEVVVPHNSTGLLMKLITAKIDTFWVHDHTFVRHPEDSASITGLKPGFHDLAYHHGDLQLLVNRRLQIQERATTSGMEGEFEVIDKYYIRKNGTYHPVSGKRSVYKVFGDKRKQLQKFASAQRLRFRRDKEAAILALVRYYDSLASAAE